MTTYTLRVGYITFHEEITDEFYLEIIEKLAKSFGGKRKSLKENAFSLPCSVDCQDFSCVKNIDCNLIEYTFEDESTETPNNLVRCHGALAMFDPVCAVKTINPNDPTDMCFWNRFDEDDENSLDKLEVLN